MLERVTDILHGEGHEMTMHVKSHDASEEHPHLLKENIKGWIRKRFVDREALVVIGAVGITVRNIAPFIRDKRQDPAVILIDEAGKFCIPLLSGHTGAANALAELLAGRIGAVAVITTSNDISHVFDIARYAEDNRMILSNPTYAKEVSASLLSGYPVGFVSDFPVKGELPEGFLHRRQMPESSPEEVTLGVYISPFYKDEHFDHCLWLIPGCITIGIGCRSGSTMAQIEEAAEEALRVHYLYPEAVCQVASIDLKEGEAGLSAYCEKMGVPLVTFSADELEAAQELLVDSDYAVETHGPGDVCRRSALLAGGGHLFGKKISKNGVSCALAIREETIHFSSGTAYAKKDGNGSTKR